MSFSPTPNSPRFSSSRQGYSGNSSPHYDTATPPPPPPKPSSHEASRGGTPHTSAPTTSWAAPPVSSSLSREVSQSHSGHPVEQLDQRLDVSGDDIYSRHDAPQPPNIEEGWIPDILKDKSYGTFFFCFSFYFY